MEIFVLVHVKHVWNPKTKKPVDKHRWHSVHPDFDSARDTAREYADAAGIINNDDMPLHVWWSMSADDSTPRKWWLSNEFGPNDKGVGNSFRIYKMEDAR